MFYSIIIPVYNRPDEIDELLLSLENQTYKNFEIILVEDGSLNTCADSIDKYKSTLTIEYLYQANAGPALARNYGASKSKGNYLIFVDSDCIIPKTYLEEIEKELSNLPVDAFGGADQADKSFTKIQKAINYSMTSFFTTGGIRGGKKRLDRFYPRSFNLGVKRNIFDAVKGFSDMRFGEDIDFSIRIISNGYTCRFFSKAWVYHKRRTNLRKFFKQVYNSGIARINLYKKFPETLKAVHLLPAAFTVGLIGLFTCSFLSAYTLVPVLLYAMLIFVDASIRTRSLYIGLLSVTTSFVQLIAYGSGFLYAYWKVLVLKRSYATAFNQTFYK